MFVTVIYSFEFLLLLALLLYRLVVLRWEKRIKVYWFWRS